MSVNPLKSASYTGAQDPENEQSPGIREIVSAIVERAMAEKASAAASLEAPASAPSTFLVSDLKKALTSGTKLYRLLPNGEKVDVGDREYLTSSEIFLEPGESPEGFPCTHHFLEQHWQPSDYKWILSKGQCAYIMCEYDCTLMQRGMLRFGCPIGFSMDGIKAMLQNPTRVLQMQVAVKCQPDSPSQKPINHTAHCGIDVLRKMDQRDEPKICPGEIPSTTLQKSDMQFISEQLGQLGSLLEESKKQQTRPYYCKECKGYLPPSSDKVFGGIQAMREKGIPVFACPGCNSLIRWEQGCSMIFCQRETPEKSGCISGTRTCACCVEGNTGLLHDLASCSAKISECSSQRLPLPPMRLCACPKDTGSPK